MSKWNPGVFALMLGCLWTWTIVAFLSWSGIVWIMYHGDAWWTGGALACCVIFCIGSLVTTLILFAEQFKW